MASATLKMLLLGEDRSASKALRGVGDEAQRTHGALGLLSTGLKTGAVALGGMSVAAGAWALKSAVGIQTATSNLTTLTGSASMAKDMVAQLSAYGNSTTFDTEPLAQAAQQMLAFGISSKDVLPDMKMLGDIAMGNQEKLSGLAYVFAQVQGTGHLMGGDLNQMINNGFNPLLDMSKRTGKSMGELRAEMAKGKISFADVKKSMEDATAKGGMFYKGASNGSKTLAGAWGNLTGTISSGLGMALQPALPVISNVITKIAGFTSVAIPAVVKFAKTLSDNLKPTLRTVGDFMSHYVAPALSNIARVVTTYVIPTVLKFGHFLTGTLIPAMVKVWQKVATNLKPVFEQLARTFQSQVVPTLRKLWEKFEQMRPSIQKLIMHVQHLTGKFYEIASAVLGKVLPPLIKLAGWIFSHVVPAIANFIGVAVKIINKLFDFASAVGDAASAVGHFAKKVADKIGDVIGFFNHLGDKIVGAVSGFGSLLVHAGGALIDGLARGIWNGTVGKLKSTLSNVTSFIAKHKGPIEKDRVLLTPAGIALMDGLIRGIESRKIKLGTALGKVTAFIAAQNDKIKALMDARSGIVDSVKGFASSVFGADFSDQGGASVTNILAYQTQQRAQAQQLQGDIARLVRMGLSKDLISQMVNSGASGMANIHALASGSVADVRQLNALNSQTNAALGAAGMAAGGALYNNQIAAATRDRNTAVAIRRELEAWRREQDKNTMVVIHLEGRTLQASLLQLKRKNGNKPLGLT